MPLERDRRLVKIVRPLGKIEEECCRKHGYIWIYDAAGSRSPGSGGMQWYRALADGHRDLWFDSEVEEIADARQ